MSSIVGVALLSAQAKEGLKSNDHPPICRRTFGIGHGAEWVARGRKSSEPTGYRVLKSPIARFFNAAANQPMMNGMDPISVFEWTSP